MKSSLLKESPIVLRNVLLILVHEVAKVEAPSRYIGGAKISSLSNNESKINTQIGMIIVTMINWVFLIDLIRPCLPDPD